MPVVSGIFIRGRNRGNVLGAVKKKKEKISGNFTWGERANKVLPRYMAQRFYKMGEEGQLTSAHNLGHVQRVSLYASLYVKAMGGNKKKQNLAKIAGWAHDRLRDPADSMAQKAAGNKNHEQLGAEHMAPIFGARYNPRDTRTIIEAMAKHGSLPALNELGKNLVRDAVVFADKFFEANGAYIGFRRSMFMGERTDLREKAIKLGIDLKNPERNPELLRKAATDFVLAESAKRIKAFSDLSAIPAHLHPFLKYQVAWQQRLVEGLQQNDRGIVNLATTLFAEGLKEKPRDLGEMIRTYKPVAETDKAFKDEAMRYLDGALSKKFLELVKRPTK